MSEWQSLTTLPHNAARLMLTIENSNGERMTEAATVDDGQLDYWHKATDEGDLIWIPVCWMPWPETPTGQF